nr:MAG TPA: hypothetical protein [Caudoviricetes sp.]
MEVAPELNHVTSIPSPAGGPSISPELLAQTATELIHTAS